MATTKKPTTKKPTTEKPTTNKPTPPGTQVRISPETHTRIRTFAKSMGVSQVALLRTLSFATAAEYVACEQRRLRTLDGQPRDDDS